jgi:hypothetical protein
MDLAAAKNKHNQSQFHGQIKNHPNGWPNNEGKNETRATKNSVMRQHGAQTLQAGFRALNIVVLRFISGCRSTNTPKTGLHAIGPQPKHCMM